MVFYSDSVDVEGNRVKCAFLTTLGLTYIKNKHFKIILVGIIVKLSLSHSISLSISIYLNLSLSLGDRVRADTIITLPPHHHTTANFLRTLEFIYTQL